MKRTLFLTLFVSVICTIGSLQAQDTYDLYQMTNEEFAAGGNKSSGWSFERYDKEQGRYTPFAMYDDSSKINVTDTYAYYRFGGEIKGNIREDIPWGQPDHCFNPAFWSLYQARNEYVYIGNKDAKFETQATKQISPAFVFTAPSDGYYKMEMSVQNQDAPTERFDPYPMIVNRYRYANQDDIDYVNQLSDMGKNVSYCQGGTGPIGSGKELPDGTITDRTWYSPFQPENYYFYFYAKQGDKVTVEATYGDGEDNTGDFATGSSLWNRTRWHVLKATKVTQNEAEADARYVNPYGTPDRTVLDAIANEAYDLQMEANPGKLKGQYPSTAIAAFNAVVQSYDNADAAGFINAMTVRVWEKTLENAIETFRSQKNEVTWAEHYKLFPYDASDDNEVAQHNAWIEEQGTTEDLDAVRWKFYAYINESGNYTKASKFNTIDKYNSTESWNDGNDWFFLARDGFVHPLKHKQPAIIFTAPQAGYYKIYSAIKRNNTSTYEMFARYRYIPASTSIDAMNVPKESFLVAKGYGAKGVLTPSDTSFYVILNAGDRLTFEQDCYTPNNNGGAGSTWVQLAIIDLQKEYASAEEILEVIAADDKRSLVDPFKKGDFTDLSDAIAKSNELIASLTDKIGETIGKYPLMAKLTFEEVISEAEEMVADDVAAQYQIDIMKSKLDAANIAFINAQVTVMCDPVGQTIAGEDEVGKLPNGAYYIKSPSGYYLTAPDAYLVEGTNNRKNVYYSKKINPETPAKNAQVWNIQYNQSYDSDLLKRYTMVTCLNNDVNGGSWTDDGVGHFGEKGSFMEGNTVTTQSTSNNNHVWRNFSIYFDGEAYCFYNVHNKWALMMEPKFENEEVAETAKIEWFAGKKIFYYQLVPMADDKEDYNPGTGIYDNTLDELPVIIMGSNNSIVVANAEAGYTTDVYDISGRLIVRTKLTSNYGTINSNPGLYIVKVSGKKAQKVAKVIVK